jgi:hypothetical protein
MTLLKNVKICLFLNITISLLPCAYAAQNDNYHGKLALDQSQNIYFEKFSPSTYSLELLNARNKFDYETLVIGGLVEGDLQYWQGNNILLTPSGNYQTGNGLYLTQATIDTMANITKWGTAFLSISEMQIGQGGSSGNYVYLPHAFITIGNLDSFPIYLTLGINSIPFGVFTGSGIWDTPLTSAYFNPLLGQQINLAFYKNNLNINAVAYRDEVNYEYHFVSSISYNNTFGDFNFNLGAGFLTNLKTNSTGNIGTVNNRKSESPIENIGNVVDTNASIGYKLVALNGEFLTGSNKINDTANKPSAYSMTLSFTPTLFKKITTFGINRSVSLALNNIPATLPGRDNVELASSGLKSTWAVSASRSIYKDNITLGLDAVRALTYGGLYTYAYTMDLLIYI